MLLTVDWRSRLSLVFGLAAYSLGYAGGGAQAFCLVGQTAAHQKGCAAHYRCCYHTNTDRDPQWRNRASPQWTDINAASNIFLRLTLVQSLNLTEYLVYDMISLIKAKRANLQECRDAKPQVQMDS